MTTMTAAQVRTHTGGMEQVPDPRCPAAAAATELPGRLQAADLGGVRAA